MSGAEQPNSHRLSISCLGVTKTYGAGPAQVQALRGIELDVTEGELLLLVGPSGCGKTTLISIIAGLLDPDPGYERCFVLEEEVPAMTQPEKTAFRREHVGFVFQAFNLIPQLTAAENVMVPLLLNGVTKDKALAQSRDALSRVGLSERTASLPMQLSGGQQQRVAIARSLIHNPKLIVCDEPTSALDHATGQQVMKILREIAVGESRTLVVVTHDARIFSYADRIAYMDDGKITGIEPPPTRGGH